MTDWIKVNGDCKPLDVDMVSSKTTVYEHRNAVQVEREENGQKIKGWEYEERTYNMQEYAMELAKRNGEILDVVEAQTLFTALMTDTLIKED